MTSVARRVSYQVLLNVMEKGMYPNIALADALRRQAMYGDDRALCTHIVYGTLQRQLSLDAMLKPFVTRGTKDLDLRVLTILRMTAYQLCYLSKVPAYAAVNEAVELCKGVLPRAAGFVNGVFRSFMRDGRSADDRIEALTGSLPEDEALALRHSFPLWMVRRWLAVYGAKRTDQMLTACNRPATLSVRVNRLKTDVPSVIAGMSRDFGFDSAAASSVSPYAVRIATGFDVERWSLYETGCVSVQDESAMLVAPLLDVQPGQRVLDMCAAPGSKTTHLAELLHDDGEVVAVDIHPHKVRLIQKAVSRMGLTSVQARVADAAALTPETVGQFDAVLVDAPCSGLGVLRHRPDIRYKRTTQDIAALVDIQHRLLESAARLVRPGGALVYATCTLLPEENDEQVRRFIAAEQGDWRVDDVTRLVPSTVMDRVDRTDVGFTITPEMFGTDGFFMTRLVKVKDRRVGGGTP